jgi:hypothetical protein
MKIELFALVFAKEEREITYLLAAIWLAIIRGFPRNNLDKSIPSTQISKSKRETSF